MINEVNEKRKTYETRLDNYLKTIFIIFCVLFSLFFLFSLTSLFVILFTSKDNLPARISLYVLMGVSLLLSLSSLTTFVILSIRLYKIVYQETLGVSLSNIKALASYNKDLEFFKNKKFQEIEELNASFVEVAKNFEGGKTITSKISTFEDLKINYIDESLHLVSEEFLRSNITKLILASESYRNAVIDISYDLGETLISEKDSNTIIKYLGEYLDYPKILFANKSSEQGFLIYVPIFDSLSQLKEELVKLMKNIALIRRDITGKQVIMPYLSLVIYPYSELDNILSDLDFAVRQKKIFNFYTREIEKEDKKKMFIPALNVNNISRLIEEISSIDISVKNYYDNVKKIEDLISALTHYYEFSSGGYIAYDDELRIFKNKFVTGKQSELTFKPNVKVNANFLKVSSNIVDNDNSYYFTSRKHISPDFARFLSKYHVRSGIIYIVKENNRPRGMLYFFNKENSLSLDTYMKTNLIIACHLIAKVVKEMESNKLIDASEKRYHAIMKLASLNIYTVDRKSYNLVAVSSPLSKLIPKLELGKKCYEKLYGLKEPCPNCPLKRNKHMLQKLVNKNVNYETYEIMKNENDDYGTLIIKENKEGSLKIRYDDETLLPTLYQFKEELASRFMFNESGSVLLLHVNNLKHLLVRLGNSGYLDLMKNFNLTVIDNYEGDIDIYQFNKETYAVILSTSNTREIINLSSYLCENTVELHKDDTLKPRISYIVSNYTSKMNIDDYYSHLLKLVKDKRNYIDDEIIFTDIKYKRSASPEGYLYESLVEAFSKKTFNINFQPVVDNKTRLIIGAELFLSVLDKESSLPLNIGEAIKVCEKRDYLGEISKGLLNFVDNLLKKYDYTFFVTSGIKRLSLNMGFGFFKDDEAIKIVKALIEKYKLPSGFIGFEIREDDFKDHKDEYKPICKKLNDIGVNMVIDQYHGEIVSLKDAFEAGFKEVKVSRDLVSAVKDKTVLEKVIAIWNDAVASKLSITFLGIENRLASEAIHNGDHPCNVQGNYYFIPMNEEDLFASIRQRNMMDKEMDT